MDTSRTSPRSLRTTPAFRLPLLASVALVSSLALGGCTGGGSAPPTAGDVKVTPFVPNPAVLQKGVECPVSADDFPTNADLTYPSEPRGSVPKDFVVEKVVVCRTGTADVDGSGKFVVKQEELQGDFAPLLKALAVPSDRVDSTDGGKLVCPAILETMPIVWLVNAKGDAIDVAVPTTQCRQASGKPDTQKAIDGLTVSSTMIVPASGK